MPMEYHFHKRNMPYGSTMWSTMVPHPSWPATPLGDPHEGLPWPPRPSRNLFGNIQKGVFPQISQKALSLFTTTFFSVWSNWKYSCGLRTFPVPTKIIFNASRNNSGFSDFHLWKATKAVPAVRNISGFCLWKISEVTRTILVPSNNFQACAETNLT